MESGKMQFAMKIGFFYCVCKIGREREKEKERSTRLKFYLLVQTHQQYAFIKFGAVHIAVF